MDLVGNLFGKLKQAGINGKYSVLVERSHVVFEILSILYKEGFIDGFRVVGNNFEVFLKYLGMAPVFYKFKRYSTYSNKYYCSLSRLLKEFRKSDFLILSTTHGIVTKDHALSLKLGGEILVKIN
jgi:ribosomal protein S8